MTEIHTMVDRRAKIAVSVDGPSAGAIDAKNTRWLQWPDDHQHRDGPAEEHPQRLSQAGTRWRAELVITDHGEPVAKLVPIDRGGPVTLEEKLQKLVEQGLITHDFNASRFSNHEPVDVGGDLGSSIVIEDRS